MDDTPQHRQCGRKVIYPDRACAERSAKLMHKTYKAKFNAYHCDWCNGFHVGRQRSREAAIRRSARKVTA